jgi:ribosomal protein S7
MENRKKSNKLRLTESELISLVERIINEQMYNSKKLYSREYVVNKLTYGPRELRKIIKELPYLECFDNNGKSHVCTRIPQVVYEYLEGKY